MAISRQQGRGTEMTQTTKARRAAATEAWVNRIVALEQTRDVCAFCGDSLVRKTATRVGDGRVCHAECFVPPLSSLPRGATSDFLVAPPNAKNVTPR
jgi:hypothetical protein